MQRLLSIALLALFSLTTSLAHAQAGFVAPNASSVNCDASGNCGTIDITPSTDGYQYYYQASCLTTTPIANPDYNSIVNCNWAPAFYNSYDACDYGNASWGTADCPMTVLESGQPAGTYSIYLYIDYLYCPNSQYSANSSTCANYYTSAQQLTVSGSVASTGGGPSPTYSWVSGAWGACSNGTESRSVSCQDQNGNTVASSYCNGAEPSASQSCTSAPSGPACTSTSCQAVNAGPGVTLSNCTPDAAQGKFCVVVPTGPQ